MRTEARSGKLRSTVPPGERTNIYLFGRLPSIHRYTMGQVGEVMLDTPWEKESNETIATGIAVCTAESGRDPRAHLTYIRMPGFMILDPDADEPTVIYRSPAFAEARDAIRALPPKRMTLTTFRREVKEIGGFVFKADRGLWQLNSTYIKGGDATVLDPVWNTRRAHVLFADRGFQPWAAYNSGHHERNLAAARETVGKLRA